MVLGPYVVMSSVQHAFADGSVRFGGSIAKPITIGAGSWISAACARLSPARRPTC